MPVADLLPERQADVGVADHAGEVVKEPQDGFGELVREEAAAVGGAVPAEAGFPPGAFPAEQDGVDLIEDVEVGGWGAVAGCAGDSFAECDGGCVAVSVGG